MRRGEVKYLLLEILIAAIILLTLGSLARPVIPANLGPSDHSGSECRAPVHCREFYRAAARYWVPVKLLVEVARQESNFTPGAVSPAGAIGIMQILPATGEWFCKLDRSDLFHPDLSIDCSARYLAYLRKLFGSWELAVAGYNAGPGAVMYWRGVPPYPETQKYIRTVKLKGGFP